MVLSKKQKLIGFLVFSAVLAFLVGIVPQSIGFFGKGFDTREILDQYFLYVSYSAISLLLIASLFFIEKNIAQGDSKYGDGLAYYHAGELPSIRTNIFDNPYRLFLGSAVIFSILGLFAAYNQTAFTGVGSIEQQFTPAGQLTFSSILIPIAENLGAAATIAFTIFLVRFGARKYGWSKQNFQLIAITSAVLIAGLFGLVNHTLRYQTSDIALGIVFLFWAFGGLISLITGSFIPFWIMHIANNLFFELTKFFSNDSIVIYTIFVIILLIVLFGLTFIKKR